LVSLCSKEKKILWQLKSKKEIYMIAAMLQITEITGWDNHCMYVTSQYV